MKARPILFNAEMVRALLDGQKTQTRRQIKPQPDWISEVSHTHTTGPCFWPIGSLGQQCGAPIPFDKCPYGQPGDLLWVRETCAEDVIGSSSVATYKADDTYLKGVSGCYIDWWYSRQFCPSIHMPRWASRLTLEITDIRVDRVQDISEEDAKAEGCETDEYLDRLEHFECCAPRDLDIPVYPPTIRGEFEYLWNSINSNWDDSPWVWMVKFKIIHANVDEVLKKEG